MQNQWRYGLCQCIETPSDTVKFICLPCCYSIHLTYKNFKKIQDQEAKSRAFLACILPCIYFSCNRLYIREKYEIEGIFIEDFCLHCLCHCCALVQEKNEIFLPELLKKSRVQNDNGKNENALKDQISSQSKR